MAIGSFSEHVSEAYKCVVSNFKSLRARLLAKQCPLSRAAHFFANLEKGR